MKNFPDQLVLIPYLDGVNFVVGQDFRYIANNGEIITVPAGFITDLASIPKIFWNIYDRWGPYGPACIIHDFNYWMQNMPREKADALLLEGMVNLNVDNLTRFDIYNAVRLFGQHNWDDNAKEDKATGFINTFNWLVEVPELIVDTKI